MHLKHFGLKLVLAVAVVAGLAGAAAAQSGEKWVCTAEKLKSFSYKGGKNAMIHLSPYNKGGSYKVTKESDTKVTGKTKDGTPFTCEKQVSS